MDCYWCTCGLWFKTRRRLIEHIALGNPSWPKTSETDRHSQLVLVEAAQAVRRQKELEAE